MPTLEHANASTAQTWNRLKINEIAFDVPEAESISKPAVLPVRAAEPATVRAVDPGELPAEFAGIETGIGEEAATWTDAAAAQVALVEVPEGAELDEPIVVDLAEKDVAASTAIGLGARSAATVVVIADSEDPDVDVTSSIVRLVVGDGAKVDIFEIVALPDSHGHMEGFGIEVGDGATVSVRQYSLSAGTSIVGLACNMAGAESRFDLQLHYLGRGEQRIDVNHLVRMRGCNTRARIDESGVLSDSSHKTLRATIDLIRGGKGAKGREQETVVVTGDDVVSKTLPVILCNEDDVQGDHGATIGSMSAEQLAYMHDRGLTTEQAEELFERAVVDEAVIHAPTKRAHDVALEAARMLFGQDAVDEIADAMDRSWS